MGFIIARHLYQEALKSAGKQNLVLEDMEVDDSGNVASVATKEELVTSSVEKLGLIQFYSVFMLQCYVRGFRRQTKMSMEEYPVNFLQSPKQFLLRTVTVLEKLVLEKYFLVMLFLVHKREFQISMRGIPSKSCLQKGGLIFP